MRSGHGPLVAVLALGAALAPATAGGAGWPGRGARLERVVREGDAKARAEAVRRAAQVGGASARRVVALASADEDVGVRVAALETGRALALPELDELAVTWLGSVEPALRRAAAEHFGARAFPAAVPALARVLGDPEAAIRLAAARGLARSGAAAAVLPLVGRLDDPAPEVRVAVVDGLAALGDPSAAVPLLGRLKDSRPDVRSAVARSLGRLRTPSVALPLIEALTDADDDVRAAAAESLGRLRAEGAEAALTRALRGAPAPVASAILLALGRLGTPTATAAIVELMATTDEVSVARAAASALPYAAAAAAEPLSRCVGAAVVAPQAQRCARSLGELRVVAAVPVLAEALRGGRFEVEALGALGALGDPAALGVVLERLADERAAVRWASIEAAARLLDPREPDGRAVEPLAAALRAPGRSLEERQALIVALGRTGSARAARVLGPYLRDASATRLRLAALEAVGWLGASGRLPAVLAAVGDPDPAVRLAAGAALARTGDGSDARRLLGLVRSGGGDRGAIALAVGGILARVHAPAAVEAVAGLARAARGAERDAWIEALGGARGGSAALARLIVGDRADRAKVAEALGGQAGAAPLLAALAGDGAPEVRANALWSLGAVGTAADLERVARGIEDRDLAVAGSAVAAFARLAQRAARDESPRLCALVGDARPHVRANALAGLLLIARRCPGGEELRALRIEALEEPRARAVELVRALPGDPRDDSAALEEAGALPGGSPTPAGPGAGAPARGRVLVHVVPPGEDRPVPRAPFALVLPSGLTRLGLADRRGAVAEYHAGEGELRLGVPAPYLR